MEWYLKVVKDNYANFSGRASVKEFWMFVLFNIIFSIALAAIGAILKFYYLGAIYSLAVLIPSLAVSVRRLHDTGKSGWMLLLGLIPFVGLILIYFFIINGNEGDNKYGAPAEK